MRRLVDESSVQNAYAQALEIIEKVGVSFESDEAKEIFKNRGCKLEGHKVFIPKNFVEEALKSVPKQDYGLNSKKRVVAATPFSNAPFLLDDDSGTIRRCNIDDAIKFYQINETSSLYECVNPGCADPIGNDAEDQFVAQVAMALKYSNKFPSFGLRATGSTAKGGDVYNSARKAFRMIREFYDVWDEPVMSQGICPNPPLAYDLECLENLCAAIDEEQSVCIIPCSLGFLTGPESIMGIVVHDFAMSLAGLVYAQLKSPGHPVSFCSCSTISNLQTMQPNYGSVESVFIQVAYYELCKHLTIPCVIGGSYGDGTAVDYQAGMEAALTAMLPFSMTDINEVWCYPGHLGGFSCGSFHKAILDEEMMRYANRMLQGVELSLDAKLPEILEAGRKAGGFLAVGSMDVYRRDNYLTKVFNKWGVGLAGNEEKSNVVFKVKQVIKNRIASYELPERSSEQKKLLQPYLPSQCRY